MLPIKRLVPLLLVSFQWFWPGHVASGQDHNVPGLPPAIVGAKPADLLACLPPTPLGWKLTRSDSSNTFVLWMTTRAQRSIKQDPPPPLPGMPPPVPGFMWIRINDDGYSYDYSPGFAPPKTGIPPPDTTYLKFGEYPARKQTLDSTTFSMCILVKKRFMIEVHAQNVLDKDAQSYLMAVDFRKLLAIPDTGLTQVPQPAVLTKIDELHPTNSKTYSVYWSAPEQRKKTGD